MDRSLLYVPKYKINMTKCVVIVILCPCVFDTGMKECFSIVYIVNYMTLIIIVICIF